MKLKLDYLVHHVQFFTFNSQLLLLIGGGGGEGIPNRLTLTSLVKDKLNVVQEIHMNDDIVWHFEMGKDMLAIGTTDKVLLMRLHADDENTPTLSALSIDEQNSDKLVTITSRIERKLLTWTSLTTQDEILVTNDEFAIQAFRLESSTDDSTFTLKQRTQFKGLKHPIFSIDLNREHQRLFAVSEGNQICVWDLHSADVLYHVDIPVQSPARCRYCAWAMQHELYVLHSSVRQPTTVSILQALDSDDSTYTFVTKRLLLDKQHSMAFKLKHHRDSDKRTEHEFLALGGKSDVIVYNTTNLKRIFVRRNVHDDPITTMDIHCTPMREHDESTQELWVASAGMDRCVNVFRTHPKGESSQLYFYFFAVFFLLMAILAARYHFFA